jgi:hypothetical protein
MVEEAGMSRIFGPIYQNGYVVADLGAAIDHWVNRLGVGPFYRMTVEFDRYVHRGVESSPVLDVALANSGDLQIELIAQLNDAPSAYLEFLRDHGPGMQHVSACTDSFDADVARWSALGLPVVTEVRIKDAVRAVFYDTDPPAATGAQMEVLERNDLVRFVTRTVREAAIGWDGRDPVRNFPAV